MGIALDKEARARFRTAGAALKAASEMSPRHGLRVARQAVGLAQAAATVLQTAEACFAMSGREEQLTDLLMRWRAEQR